jgi:uncharacterized membrane protein (DUF106 family)
MNVLLIPPYSIVFIITLAFLLTLITNIISKKRIDYDKMRQYQKVIKEYTDLQKEFLRTGDKKLEKKLGKMRYQYKTAQSEMMRMSFIPTMYTIIPIMIIFILLGGFYSEIPFIRLPIGLPYVMDFFHGRSVFGNDVLGYFGVYVLASFFFSTIIQKIMKTSPTQ